MGYFPNKILLDLKDGTIQVAWEQILGVQITRLPGLQIQWEVVIYQMAIKIVQLFLILFPFSLFFQKTTAYLMMFLCLAKLQITLQDVVEVEEMIVPVTK